MDMYNRAGTGSSAQMQPHKRFDMAQAPTAELDEDAMLVRDIRILEEELRRRAMARQAAPTAYRAPVSGGPTRAY